uniref:WW domain-containing protein n=1 Tax=Aphanomyces astaci TaxID=112090 RepID=A0A418E9Q2_APHAT|nr:hypothetical protein DYB37_000690 [Aphanomyces astaci]
MLNQTSSFLDTAAKAGVSHHPTETKVKKAMEDISTIDSGIRTLIGHVKKSLKCKHLTRADAVRKIQDMWKVRKARKHFKALLRSIYKRMEDPVTGKRIQRMFRCGMARRQMRGMISRVYVKIWDDTRAQFYFYNTSTKTVSWAKPKWVDEDDLMSPRTHQAFLLQEKVDAIRNGPPDAAVQYLQRLIRRRQARRRLQVMLAEVYEMVLDEATGEYFYHNKKTGNVTWTKPPLIQK